MQTMLREQDDWYEAVAPYAEPAVPQLVETTHHEKDEITLTCKMGVFTFHKSVQLSKAKLIRDSIMGQYFNRKPNEPAITDETSAQAYARNHLGRDLEYIPFGLSITG